MEMVLDANVKEMMNFFFFDTKAYDISRWKLSHFQFMFKTLDAKPRFGSTTKSLTKMSKVMFHIGTNTHLYNNSKDVNIALLLNSKFDSEKLSSACSFSLHKASTSLTFSLRRTSGT
ncbi:hypothetical protein RJT34_12097 [Clitoria ternatea]|uniref:Uncharacterized protein n=1 Tax=Clitoria ternatea TaxID=43366 RepID=A0AAN9PK60_CLITE